MKRLGRAEILSFKTREEFEAAVAEHYTTYPCPDCGEATEIERGAELPADQRCYDCQRKPAPRPPAPRHRLLEVYGVPARFRTPFQARRWPGATERPDDPAAWQGEPWACGFLGESGSGKTFLATELYFRNLPKEPRSAVWVRADRLVGWLFGREGDEGRAKATAALNAKLVCIDDLGWGTLGTSIEALFGFVAHRHAELLPTIWTSNHTNEQLLGTAPGQALLRRLRDGLVVPCRGEWKKHLTVESKP